MHRQIIDYIRQCVDFQRYKSDNLKHEGILRTPVMKQRFHIFAVDLFGHLQTSKEEAQPSTLRPS